MRMILSLMILALSACEPVYAADEWTTADIALETTFAALAVLDWGQTLEISSHPAKYSENNAILGQSPRRGTVNIYFPATIALHALASHYLPAPYRRIWQSVTVGVELAATSINYQAGIRMGF